jgi:hypothetical protein
MKSMMLALMAAIFSMSVVEASSLSATELVLRNQIKVASELMLKFEQGADWYINEYMDTTYSAYKAKHQKSTPVVSSFKTQIKNNWILAVSIGITLGCYYSAGYTLVLDNDAGAFFTDCMTMWTMYVFFYEDERAIDYQLYG